MTLVSAYFKKATSFSSGKKYTPWRGSKASYIFLSVSLRKLLELGRMVRKDRDLLVRVDLREEISLARMTLLGELGLGLKSVLDVSQDGDKLLKGDAPVVVRVKRVDQVSH